jgi:hypothetical protein
MAENESLDLGKARRWHRVFRAVVDGRSAGQIASLASVCLRQTVNALRKPAFGSGPPQVPIADLLNAVGDPCEVERLVRRCQGHDFAHLFRDSTLNTESREVAAENFLSAICEKFCDQIVMKAVQADGQHTFTRERSLLEQVQAQLGTDIKRIAQQLATNPNQILRRPRSVDAKETAINTQSILGESLLGIKR